MDISTDECRHGIPIVNGYGCVICSNRNTKPVIYINMSRIGKPRGSKLSSLDGLAEEIPAEQFV